MASREDPYILPNGTLRNALGLTDASKLTGAEADLVSVRDWILRSSLPRPPYTFDTLKAIHRTSAFAACRGSRSAEKCSTSDRPAARSMASLLS